MKAKAAAVAEPVDIGDVIERTGVPASTLHLWERRGLVQPVARRGLRRQYDPGVVARIAIILAFQHGGFSLAEIAAVVGAAGDASRQMMNAKLEALATQRAQLDVAIAGIEHALRCPEPHPFECPSFRRQALDLLPTRPARVDQR